MVVKSIQEVPAKPVEMEGAEKVRMRLLISEEDGAPNFRMRLFEVEPGGFSPYHTHNYEHEVLILEGEGEVRGEQGSRPFARGDVVFVPPNEPHQFVNKGSGVLKFICLIPIPGKEA
ncbi:MAG TPA: cupin domain-containing protein [Bacteroidetes bacterium]|nr:cupin domain-containing protein [Bacteroidota bacterium]